MTQLFLQLNTLAKDVERMNDAGMRINISKVLPGTPNTIVWISLPFSQQIDMTWQSSKFTIFASNTRLEEGAQIVEHAFADAVRGDRFRLVNNVFKPLKPGENDSIAAEYISERLPFDAFKTIGISQGATVNGQEMQSPIIAAPTFIQQTVSFTIPDSIRVSVGEVKKSGQVVARVTGISTQVDYLGDTGSTSEVLDFDPTLSDYKPAL
jgi:hypothetical protein